MLLTAVPGATLAALALLLPGMVWAWWAYPSPSRAMRLTVGLALGFAWQMHVAALLAAGPGITRASVATETLIALTLASFLAWRMRIPRLARHRGRRTIAWSISGLLALSLLSLTLLHLIPLAYQQVPQGWDPSFHALLASTTVATGKLPTWRPFEPIDSNYPYGPHVFIAETSLLTGSAPDAVFAVLLDALLPALSGLALYAFARRVFRRGDVALAASVAYGFLGNWGSFEYGAWGGLPNALGFFLVLAFLTTLFAPSGAVGLVPAITNGRGLSFGWRHILTGGALLSAIPLTHHHVLLTMMLLLGVFALYLLVRLLPGASAPLTRRREPLRVLLRLALMSGVALAVVAYYAIPYAAKARQLHDTSALTYLEEYSGWVFPKNGNELWALSLLGVIVIAWRARRRWLYGVLRAMKTMDADLSAQRVARWRWRLAIPFVAQFTGVAGIGQAFLALASVTLFAAFFLGYYGYRTYAESVYHQPYTAFTPSRFLTDMTYFLALYAGPSLVTLWRGLDRLARWLFRSRKQHWRTAAEMALQSALALALVLLASRSVPDQIVGGAGQLAPGELAAFTWVRDHTPQDTYVLNLDPNGRWAPYFTRREVWVTPVPISEFTRGYIAEKIWLTTKVMRAAGLDATGSPLPADQPPLRVTAVVSSGTALPTLTQHPLAIIAAHSMPQYAADLVFVSGPEQVYLLPNALALTAGDALTRRDVMTPGAATLRLPFAGPLAGRAVIACRSQDVATLFVDGTLIPGGCSGALIALPQLNAPGPHTLMARITSTGDPRPWCDVLVMEHYQPLLAAVPPLRAAANQAPPMP